MCGNEVVYRLELGGWPIEGSKETVLELLNDLEDEEFKGLRLYRKTPITVWKWTLHWFMRINLVHFLIKSLNKGL
jgi:hypothetical protein